MAQTIRGDALKRLAQLSARSSLAAVTTAEYLKLFQRCQSTAALEQHSWRDDYDSPETYHSMKLQDLETVLAICMAAPLIKSGEVAEQVLSRISPLLARSHHQLLSPSLSLCRYLPSPQECLTYSLASAALTLGIRHASLRQNVVIALERYISGWMNVTSEFSTDRFDNVQNEQTNTGIQLAQIMTQSLSFLGFLKAIAEHASFWNSHDRTELVQTLHAALSENYLVVFETALSRVRTSESKQGEMKEWRHLAKHHEATGQPLGAMILRNSYLEVVVASASLFVKMSTNYENELAVLDYLHEFSRAEGDCIIRHTFEKPYVQELTKIVIKEMKRLEDDLDYLQKVGSAWHQQQAASVKAKVLVTYLCCVLYDEKIAPTDLLITWLDNVLNDPAQYTDYNLAFTVLQSMDILAKHSPRLALGFAQSLSRFIAENNFDRRTTTVAGDCLATVLSVLPEDVVITTLYSFGNMISLSSVQDQTIFPSFALYGEGRTHEMYNCQHGSMISLTSCNAEEPHLVYTTIVETIVTIAAKCDDVKITALALSMLVQKVGRAGKAADAKIISDSSLLGIRCPLAEFSSLLKFYSTLSHDALVKNDTAILEAVLRARLNISRKISDAGPTFELYLTHLLDTIVSKGDVQDTTQSQLEGIDLASREIAQLLKPLAFLLLRFTERASVTSIPNSIDSLLRNAWFNIVVHGIDLSSDLGRQYEEELRVLARFSKPLIAEERFSLSESDIELNTVLRRGKSNEHTTEQKRRLSRLLPSCEVDIRSLSYQETTFLSTAYLVENLRAYTGDCTKALLYFLDPSLRRAAVGNCMAAITTAVVRAYLTKTLSGHANCFSTPYLAQQLAAIFSACCHRILRVQQASTSCADLVIQQIPSVLCEKSALFALLDLLSLMWYSCLESETDEYTWKSRFTSARANVVLELSDDYAFRRATLEIFHKRAVIWVKEALDVAPLDIKGLLQTYLSESDEGASSVPISLGRSFAIEMGSKIPFTDKRFGSAEGQGIGINVNTASDFIMQYTTRQGFRYLDRTIASEEESDQVQEDMTGFLSRSLHKTESILANLELQVLNHKHIVIAELRDSLQRATTLLYRMTTDQCRIIYHLVQIPFIIFTKQSIKLGISLWTSLMKENPRMESRVLVEIAESWESTVHRRRGLFNPALRHQDPFFCKQEFAATDKESMFKRQQQIHDLMEPHFLLLQFLASHFSASRLSRSDIGQLYFRMMYMTLEALRKGCSQPLARETYFHIVLLGLQVVRNSVTLPAMIKWRLIDRCLITALAWFAKPPCWSFGGNRVQIRAETHVLETLQAQLGWLGTLTTSTIVGPKIRAKQELLALLIANEQSRLMVWLHPLDSGRRNPFSTGQQKSRLFENSVAAHVKTAWAENSCIAVHLVKRFQSARLLAEVRWHILNFPHRILDEPAGLEILLGGHLANDVSFQLKNLLYWAPVNPIMAVTLFMPAYRNQPLIMQYAMKALVSHSVDVMFFYVYQIVQTLRYDVLGYVEKYIIRTAKISQLFAHQIIWNMKANAYKDELSETPDPVKPALDRVMRNLESNFSSEERIFFEREFAFFNEVTSISGTLRSILHEPKEVKRQKIEEELRKIKVEVGVYLPSNPDGQVVGIDRRSGKPLQSHAKTPFMATFRIRKTKHDFHSITGIEGEDYLLSKKDDTYETWLSAIFKVGDDCRQDVLALQMIAAFRGIFNAVGLDVWVFPYRVTATAPGCGVIDVLPNSISRDMLGREAVNRLDEYFISRYGNEDSIQYQEARSNFVKSMASYSVISFLLQFKDRHNGNIMIDDAGHIIHIDFGFCFDIAPGGIKFERAPFKLTSEMIAVMSGANSPSPFTTQAYRWFEELTVKAFLAARQHCSHLSYIVEVMLDSGLPCFKSETIHNFKERFVLDRSEKEAAEYMKGLVEKSRNSYSTGTYDRFQLITNGIPY